GLGARSGAKIIRFARGTRGLGRHVARPRYLRSRWYLAIRARRRLVLTGLAKRVLYPALLFVHHRCEPSAAFMIGGLPGADAAFLDTGSLAAQIAEVVQLGAAHPAVRDDLDLVEGGAVHGKRPLDADAVADL